MKHPSTTVRFLLEAANRLRELERAWHQSGSLEDELAYYRERLKIGQGIELTQLTVPFTRWKPARIFFRDIFRAGRWETELRVHNRLMRDMVPAIGEELFDTISNRVPSMPRGSSGSSFELVALGWRADKSHLPGFLYHFNIPLGLGWHRPGGGVGYLHGCASLHVRSGGNVTWQAIDDDCDHRIYLGSSGQFHKDSIMIASEGPYSEVWNTHISTGTP